MLEKLFGPHRALSVHGFFHNWGLLFWVLPPFLTGLYFFIQFSGAKHEHVAYVEADVLFSEVYATETDGFTASFIVKLPNGKEIKVQTESMSLSASIIDTACLEKRRYVDSGLIDYLLTGQKHCEK